MLLTCVKIFMHQITYNYLYKTKVGLFNGAVVSHVTSPQEGSGFKPVGQLGPFFLELACSFHVCVGFL